MVKEMLSSFLRVDYDIPADEIDFLSIEGDRDIWIEYNDSPDGFVSGVDLRRLLEFAINWKG